MTNETWPPPPGNRREAKHITEDGVDIIVGADRLTLSFALPMRALRRVAVILGALSIVVSIADAATIHPLSRLIAHVKAHPYTYVVGFLVLLQAWLFSPGSSRYTVSADGGVTRSRGFTRHLGIVTNVEVVDHLGGTFIRLGLRPVGSRPPSPTWASLHTAQRHGKAVVLGRVRDRDTAFRVAGIIAAFLDVPVIES